jgi:hypothetical protein
MRGDFRCKGTHVIQIRNWIDRKVGPGAFDRLLLERTGRVPEPVLVGGWYDTFQMIGTIEAAAALTDMKLEDVVTEIATQNARNDLKTVYRVFLRILAPVRVLSMLPRIWRQYFSFGEVVVLANEPGTIVLETRQIPTPLTPWVVGGWRGFLPETIRASGGVIDRALTVHTTTQGDTSTVRVEAHYVAS